MLKQTAAQTIAAAIVSIDMLQPDGPKFRRAADGENIRSRVHWTRVPLFDLDAGEWASPMQIAQCKT